MIAVDTNILVYAHRADSPRHRAAAERVRTLAEGGARWCIPWSCVYEFLAIVTHPKIYAPPSTPAQALNQVTAWLESPALVLTGEGPEHWPALDAAARELKVRGPHVHDLRIALVCLGAGVSTLWTADRDFPQVRGLKRADPL